MRSLVRNKRKMWYSLYQDQTPIVDENGYRTGETDEKFSDPEILMANISAATGQAVAEAFGAFTDYSRVISVCDMSCPLEVGSRVWFGVEPPKDHNYMVVRVADSINSKLYALKEVTVG